MIPSQKGCIMTEEQHKISAIIKIVCFFLLMIVAGFVLQDLYTFG